MNHHFLLTLAGERQASLIREGSLARMLRAARPTSARPVPPAPAASLACAQC
jgi:hypothetical protein